MPVDMPTLIADLEAETAELDRVLATIDDDGWLRETPAPGWRIHDQITHLAFFDRAARLAASDPAAFCAERDAVASDPVGVIELARREHASMPVPDVRDWFARERAELKATFAALGPSTRVPWYGPEMSAASSVTARIMETWAHGQDVADAVGVERAPTSALRQVAHIGVWAFPNSFRAHGLDVPDVVVRVELAAPDGTTWEWGDAAAVDRVRGPAVDFCLVAVQRRHVDDTALEVSGPVAAKWMQIAQAFAGPPGPGRAPR
jgi:uncharacterized protein (TIGR03084 family)